MTSIYHNASNDTMLLGIDGRLLHETNHGISRYTAQSLHSLEEYPAQLNIYATSASENRQVQKDNISFKTLNLKNRLWKMLWAQTILPYWVQKDNLDVFWSPTHRLPAFLPSSVARIVTIHDLVWKHAGKTMRPLSRFMEYILMPQAIRQADRIVAVSFSTAKAIEEEYPEVGDRIRVVHPGTTVLPAPLDFQSLSVLGVECPYFLFVGTLEPRKNLQRLLEAYASLNANIRNRARLVIAGGKGWGGVDIASWVRAMHLDDQVVYTGYVNETQLATLYAHARFLVMPSLYEGFGLPLVEAMSFGVPVLTSNLSSMPEVAGGAGVLVDPFDVHSIAKGLSSLLCNDQYRDQLASMAIRNAKRFTWQNAARDMWAVFEEAAEVRAQRIGLSKK